MPIRTFGVLISCALAGCYAPVALPPGSPCATTEGCPTDQQCVAGFCTQAVGLTSDAGVQGTGSVGNAPGDAGPGDAATCHSSNACTTAITLGTVSGDTGNETLTRQGSNAAWFRVRVTENDNTISGVPMHVLVRLNPPAGEDFDVFVYVNPDTDTLECASSSGVATTIGAMKQVRASWGEDVVPDGIDDSRDVSIEIRPRSATCAPGAQWQLVIQGNGN
jgi:hypothetical protein